MCEISTNFLKLKGFTIKKPLRKYYNKLYNTLLKGFWKLLDHITFVLCV